MHVRTYVSVVVCIVQYVSHRALVKDAYMNIQSAYTYGERIPIWKMGRKMGPMRMSTERTKM